MEDKIIIFLNREATGQLMKVSGEDAIIGYNEIKKALLGEKHSTDFGLVAADFSIQVIKPNSKSETYMSYNRGNLLTDDENCYIFKHGTKWYDALENQLNKILSDDPYHFLKDIKDRKKYGE